MSTQERASPYTIMTRTPEPPSSPQNATTSTTPGQSRNQSPPRSSSSMSRDHTQHPTNEDAQPPRDPTAHETESAEEFVYPNARGEFSVRDDSITSEDTATTTDDTTTPNTDGSTGATARGGGGARRSCYQRRTAEDGYASRVAGLPGDEAAFQRESRIRAAEMARAERESHQLMRSVDIQRLRQERAGRRDGARGIDGDEFGCCVIL